MTTIDSLPMESDRRMRFGMNARTHMYWWLKIKEATDELKIAERAAKAKDYQDRYQKYMMPRSGAGKQTINAISRILGTFVNNAVTENPLVTPQFLNAVDENTWYDPAEAFCNQKIRECNLAAVFPQLLWDNFYADIAWLKVDWETRLSSGTPTSASAQKVDLNRETAQIESENEMMKAGYAVPTNATDNHQLHLEGHAGRLAELEQTMMLMQEAAAAGIAGQEQLEALQTQMQLTGIHTQEHQIAARKVEGEKFTAYRWPSYKVYYDPFATKWEDADWYAIERVEPKEDLLDREDMSNVKPLEGAPGRDVDPLHGRTVAGRDMNTGSEESQAPTEMYVRYFIIHDRRGGSMIVIADHERNGQKPLFVGEWPFAGDIIYPLVLEQVNDQIHGVPKIERLEFVHRQLVNIENKIAEYVCEVPAAKIFIENQAADEVTIKNFKDPKKLFAKVKSLPKDSIMPWNHPGIDKNLLQERMRLQNELQLESGIPEIYNAGQSEETATAVAVRDRQAGNKIGEAKTKLADLVRWFCESVIHMYRDFSTEPQQVRVVNEMGVAFQPFNPGDLPDGIDWVVDHDSFAPSRREMERKQDLELLTTLSALFGTFVPNPTPIIRKVLQKFDFGESMGEIMTPPQMMMPGMMPGQGGAPGSPPALPEDGATGQLGNDMAGQFSHANTIE